MANKNRKLISLTEAAAILGVHRQTISNYIDRGILKLSSSQLHKGSSKYLVYQNDVFKLLGSEKYNLSQLHKDIEILKEELERARKEYKEKIKLYSKEITTSDEYKGLLNLLHLDLQRWVHYWFEVGETLHEQRNLSIIKEYIAGSDLTKLSIQYGLSREAVRNIIWKGTRSVRKKVRQIPELYKSLKDLHKKIYYLDKENESLKRINCKLKKFFMIDGNEEKFRDNEIREDDMTLDLMDCDLSVRAMNCLKAAEVRTLGDLSKLTQMEIMKFRNFGKKSLNEIVELLESRGYEWKKNSLPSVVKLKVNNL